MDSLPATPSPPAELMTLPVFRPLKSLSLQAEKASTAFTAVVITLGLFTLFSMMTLIFFYLHKNKGSYITYKPAEGKASGTLQMESVSAKGREKEKHFI